MRAPAPADRAAQRNLHIAGQLVLAGLRNAKEAFAVGDALDEAGQARRVRTVAAVQREAVAAAAHLHPDMDRGAARLDGDPRLHGKAVRVVQGMGEGAAQVQLSPETHAGIGR
jgi:hypothetical protein